MTDKRKRRRTSADMPASHSQPAPFDGETIPPFDDAVPGIPDSVENIVASFWKPPKKDGEWRYQKEHGRKRN